MPFADVVSFTTHKVLRGPRSGAIVCKAEHAAAIDKAVFPMMQGGPQMHTIAAKAVNFKECATPEYAAYTRQVVANAKVLARSLGEKGIRPTTGGTDTHLSLHDLQPVMVTGVDAEARCDAAGITLNKNAIPFDPQKPNVASGIRVGTPCVTTQGMGEDEMRDHRRPHRPRRRRRRRRPRARGVARGARRGRRPRRPLPGLPASRVRRAAESQAPVSDTSPAGGPVTPLLRRLNRRGFRIVMLLDGLAVFGLSVLSMVVRNGAPPWPTYPLSAYLLSFSVSTLIFVFAFYFGGLYEREPRLGGAAVLPRAARLSLAAGSFVALLNLALGGLLRQRGSSIGAGAALPHPEPGRGDRARRRRRGHQPGDRARPAHPARGPAPGGARR